MDKDLVSQDHNDLLDKFAKQPDYDANSFSNESVETKTQLLTFLLGEEEYALEISSIHEIRVYEEATLIPNSPDFIKGVINIRGIIVPVVDLRIKFGLEQYAYDEETIIILLSVETKIIGIVVDRVNDALNLSESDIKPAVGMEGIFSSDYLVGFGKLPNKVIVIVDMLKLLSSKEIGIISKADEEESSSNR